MDHKQAADILIQMPKQHKLSSEEQQALSLAIGVLAWTKLAQSRIKNLKNKKA